MSRRLVKVQYREKGKGRSATITLPLDIYDSWGRPAYVSIEEDEGTLIVRPARQIVYQNLEPFKGSLRDFFTLKRLEKYLMTREDTISIAYLKRCIISDAKSLGQPVAALIVLDRIVLDRPVRVVVEYEKGVKVYTIVENSDWVPELVYEIVVGEMAGYLPDKSLEEYPKRPRKMLVKVAGQYVIVEPFYD